jgi:hypothetical protein
MAENLPCWLAQSQQFQLDPQTPDHDELNCGLGVSARDFAGRACYPFWGFGV